MAESRKNAGLDLRASGVDRAEQSECSHRPAEAGQEARTRRTKMEMRVDA